MAELRLAAERTELTAERTQLAAERTQLAAEAAHWNAAAHTLADLDAIAAPAAWAALERYLDTQIRTPAAQHRVLRGSGG